MMQWGIHQVDNGDLTADPEWKVTRAPAREGLVIDCHSVRQGRHSSHDDLYLIRPRRDAQLGKEEGFD